MRKLSFLKSTISFVLILSMSVLLVNCSSSSSDDDYDYVPSTGNTFNPADFDLTVTETKINTSNMYIGYDIKNTSKISYLDKTEQGFFIIKATIKATDNTVYQGSFYVKNVEAGVTYSDYLYIDYTAGKTLDLSTLTIVIGKK